MTDPVIKVGKGVELKIGDGASTEVFTAIGRIENVALGGRSRQIVQFTSHDVDSTQKFASFLDNGQVTFGVGYDSSNTQHALLVTKLGTGAKVNFKLTLVDTGAEVYSFNAIVSNVAIPDAKTSVLVMNVTLEICETFTIA